MLAGNFNLANMDELYQKLLDLGQHPRAYTDIVTIIEKIGHFLDRENQRIFSKYKELGKNNIEISSLISKELDVASVLHEASKHWDGGYVISGIIGNGDSFIMRDPSGIRPAFYYADDEIVVAASERPVIQTAFNIPINQISEVPPGSAIIVKSNGDLKVEQIC